MGSEAGGPRAATPGQQLRALFYVLPPSESSFRTLEEVPDYVEKSIPFFIAFIGLEFVVSWIQKRKLSGRINDGISSLSLGILSRLPDVLFRSIELISYIYVWNNYRLFELPWDSQWTWYLTLLGVDFAYYWFHRVSHEVNILWAAHQVHHSSEDYNLFTALRQSILQKYTSWIFNLPIALFIPPSVFAVHLQFNLLYQFWIHTEVITKLGPLEWILNTPSHHRVHHGRNPYCIDKNYGGTLIIWDRIFGTFEAEDAKVVYGLTHPVNSFDPVMLQLRPLAHIWNTFWATPGFCNKLSVIFKGPGWGPGKPRLGLPEEIPVITGKEVPFNPSVPAYLNWYAVAHFAVILDLYTELLGTVTMLSQGTILLRIGFIILSLTSFGLLMENRPKAGILEVIRCLVFIGAYKLGHLRSQFSSLGYAYENRYGLVSWRNIIEAVYSRLNPHRENEGDPGTAEESGTQGKLVEALRQMRINHRGNYRHLLEEMLSSYRLAKMQGEECTASTSHTHAGPSDPVPGTPTGSGNHRAEIQSSNEDAGMNE